MSENHKSEFPIDFDDAIRILMEQEDSVKAAREHFSSVSEFTGRLHFFGGMALRNSWMLWYNEPENGLTTWFRERNINHGDDRSGLLLKAFYNKVNNIPFDLDKEVEFYIEYWKQNGIPDGIVPPVDLDPKYRK